MFSLTRASALALLYLSAANGSDLSEAFEEMKEGQLEYIQRIDDKFMFKMPPECYRNALVAKAKQFEEQGQGDFLKIQADQKSLSPCVNSYVCPKRKYELEKKAQFLGELLSIQCETLQTTLDYLKYGLGAYKTTEIKEYEDLIELVLKGIPCKTGGSGAPLAYNFKFVLTGPPLQREKPSESGNINPEMILEAELNQLGVSLFSRNKNCILQLDQDHFVRLPVDLRIEAIKIATRSLARGLWAKTAKFERQAKAKKRNYA
jgi:hypothetical protein